MFHIHYPKVTGYFASNETKSLVSAQGLFHKLILITITKNTCFQNQIQNVKIVLFFVIPLYLVFSNKNVKSCRCIFPILPREDAVVKFS